MLEPGLCLLGSAEGWPGVLASKTAVGGVAEPSSWGSMMDYWGQSQGGEISGMWAWEQGSRWPQRNLPGFQLGGLLGKDWTLPFQLLRSFPKPPGPVRGEC